MYNIDADTLSRLPSDFVKYMTEYDNTVTSEEFQASVTSTGILARERGDATWITAITTNPDVLDLELEHLSFGKKIPASDLSIKGPYYNPANSTGTNPAKRQQRKYITTSSRDWDSQRRYARELGDAGQLEDEVERETDKKQTGKSSEWNKMYRQCMTHIEDKNRITTAQTQHKMQPPNHGTRSTWTPTTMKEAGTDSFAI
ncbi:Hypothetical predicted protein [Paramuricea clavata]|uniref:Uncharacterized protein n=1 Tax=Paramuricea clavata TaxID=317549 RepID=A0A6S7GXB2_PARCT|nr:Hypothetical predicted protein [Paramuricea clavata]